MKNNDLENIKNDINNLEDITYLLTVDNVANLYEKEKLEEKEIEFIKSLDNYLSYIKDNYNLRKIEYFILADITLNNKYSNELLKNDIQEFRKIFLYNLYDNINYYSKFIDDNSSLYKLYLKLSEYDFEKDIIEIENIVKSIINDRNILVSNAFISHNEVINDDSFFIVIIDNLASKYFND